MVRKLSISIGDELDAALMLATVERHESKSKVVDTLLREHAVIQRYIELVRAEPMKGPLLGSTMVRSLSEKSGRRLHGQPGRRVVTTAR